MVIAKMGKTAVKASEEKYLYAVGRRKTSIARVRLYPKKSLKQNEIIINGKTLQEYVTIADFHRELLAPLEITGQNAGFRITVVVSGGGVRGQVEAIRLGVARALSLHDKNFHSVLRSAKMLTRDARKVERKKAGLKKARRAPQWAKR